MSIKSEGYWRQAQACIQQDDLAQASLLVSLALQHDPNNRTYKEELMRLNVASIERKRAGEAVSVAQPVAPAPEAQDDLSMEEPQPTMETASQRRVMSAAAEQPAPKKAKKTKKGGSSAVQFGVLGLLLVAMAGAGAYAWTQLSTGQLDPAGWRQVDDRITRVQLKEGVPRMVVRETVWRKLSKDERVSFITALLEHAREEGYEYVELGYKSRGAQGSLTVAKGGPKGVKLVDPMANAQ